MKNPIAILIAILSISNIYSQKLEGVWITTDDPISSGFNYQRSKGGIIIDFDKGYTSTTSSVSNKKISVNKKGTKIKAKGGLGKLKVIKSTQNSIHALGSGNMLYVFEKLNLNTKLQLSKKEISTFLVKQQCELIQGIKGQFTTELFFLDKKSKQPIHRNQFINYTTRDNGYWYLKKIRNSLLFVLTTGKDKTENIFQITGLDLKGIKLKQVQRDHEIRNLNEIKTCL